MDFPRRAPATEYENFAEAPEFSKLIAFELNRREPVHNWWWYKEGFSRALVDKLIDHFGANKETIILDPYCGSGTTLLACKQRGIPSVGFDINPLFVLVSRVKTREYDTEELSKFVKRAAAWKFEKPESIPRDNYLRKAFSKWALQDILWLRSNINSVGEESAREFLYLALIDAAMRGSWTVKDGALVKIKKRQVAPVKKLFLWNLKRWLKDLKKTKTLPVSCSAFCGDARRLPLGSGSIDFIITSPPYLGITDYRTAYKLELNLFFGLPPAWRPPEIALEEPQIRKLESAIPDFAGLPPEAKDYFGSLLDALGEMHRVLKSGGKVAVVVGGGCLNGNAVEADLHAAQTAGAAGFRVENVLVARRLWCTAQRTRKTGQVRESIILLEKA